MLTVDDYARIRRAHRDGMSLRAIAKKFGHSWRKVRQAVDEAKPISRTDSPIKHRCYPEDGIRPQKKRQNNVIKCCELILSTRHGTQQWEKNESI